MSKIEIQERNGEIFVYLGDCQEYIKDAFKAGAEAQRKSELKFLIKIANKTFEKDSDLLDRIEGLKETTQDSPLTKEDKK